MCLELSQLLGKYRHVLTVSKTWVLWNLGIFTFTTTERWTVHVCVNSWKSGLKRSSWLLTLCKCDLFKYVKIPERALYTCSVIVHGTYRMYCLIATNHKVQYTVLLYLRTLDCITECEFSSHLFQGG